MGYLEFRDLQKRYTKDGPLIVNNMNLSVNKNEFIVLLGPSGCGKTTTIRMVCGLEEVTSGDILVEGNSIIGLPPRDRGVSMIFQSYAIWPHMNVFDNIAYPLKLKKVSKPDIKERVERAAAATGIVELLQRYPGQMSGGQRQRVAVSRAIVAEPRIFLMDEPLSNLDAKLRVTMRTELKSIHQKVGSTTIFVTHDQSEAMSLADRIIIMNNGVIEQMGTPMEIYRNSATRFVASFIGTPPTNFFTVSIEKTAGGYTAVGDALRYNIPDALEKAMIGYEGKTVELGIRPEFIGVSPELMRGQGYLCDADIRFVEPQGSYSILISDIGGEVKIVTTDHMYLAAGTRVSLNVKDDEVMLFDTDTGIRIR